MINGENKKEPTFLEQAFGIIEEHFASGKEGYGMTILDHKLNCKILDAHERYINEMIINKFLDQIAKHYEPIMEKLDNLEKGMNKIGLDIAEINVRLTRAEKKVAQDALTLAEVDRRLETKRKRIEELEKQVKVLQPEVILEFIEKINSVNPVLDKIRTFKWWKAIIIAIGLFLAAIGAFLGIHFKWLK